MNKHICSEITIYGDLSLDIDTETGQMMFFGEANVNGCCSDVKLLFSPKASLTIIRSLPAMNYLVHTIEKKLED